MIGGGSICDVPSKDPLADICELVHRRCGVLISTERMREMFVADWNKLSTLAHAIHHDERGR